MDVEVIIYVLLAAGIFFALPSTIYTTMFLGIFYRRRSILLEEVGKKYAPYQPFAEKLKKDILFAKSIPCEEVRIKAKDGVQLFGRYYKRNSNRAIICIHGYQSSAFNNFSTAMIDFLNDNYSVLLVDQRAHGNSGGTFTCLGCKEKDDLLQWIDYVDGKSEIEDIIVYGISMGATTVGYATESIKSHKVKGLIMEAGFTCFYEELVNNFGNIFMKKAALNYIYLTSRAVLKVDIKQSIEPSLNNNKIPTLFLHGDDDKEVAMDFTTRNYSACASKKEMVVVEGAGHTLCYVAGGEEIKKRISNFINNSIEENDN